MATAIPGGGIRLQPRPAPPPTPGDDRRRTVDDQRRALENPDPVEISTAPNPFQTETYGRDKAYTDSLADKSDANIKDALQRTRDLGASAGADAAAQGGARGASPDSGAGQLIQERNTQRTQAQLAKTNQDMTATALDKEQAARSLETGSANDIARNQADMYSNQAGHWAEQQRAQMDKANLYRNIDNDRYDRIAKTFTEVLNDPLTGGPTGGPGAFNPGRDPRAATPLSRVAGGGGVNGTGGRLGTYSDIPGSPWAGGGN